MNRSEMRVMRYETATQTLTAGQDVNELLSFATIQAKLSEQLLTTEDNFNQVQILSVTARKILLDPDVLNTSNAVMVQFYKAYNPDANGRAIKPGLDGDLRGIMAMPDAKRGIWTPNTRVSLNLKPYWKIQMTTDADDTLKAPAAYSKRKPWVDIDQVSTLKNSCNGVHFIQRVTTEHFQKTWYTLRYRVRSLDNNIEYV
jgi:hypothetical protein